MAALRVEEDEDEDEDEDEEKEGMTESTTGLRREIHKDHVTSDLAPPNK